MIGRYYFWIIKKDMERKLSSRNASIGSHEEISNFRTALPQFLAVGVKNFLLFGYGMTLGFPTIVIPAIQGGDGHYDDHPKDIILNKDEISWFSSINLLCVPLGCIFSGMLTQPIGKRMAMQIVNIPIFFAWLLFYYSTSVHHLYAGLCLSGLSGGLMEAPVLTYVAEITQPKFRGMLAATGSTCLILGVFTQFLLGTFLKWRTIAAISTIFPLLSIAALFFVPESPHWLLLKGRTADARKSLAWLRGWVPIEQIENEFKEIHSILVQRPAEQLLAAGSGNSICGKFTPYGKKNFLLPFSLVVLTFFIGHFSGKTSLQTYAVQIFHTLKAPINKYYATVLLGGVEIIGTIFCVVLVHYTGKRPLVLISTVGVGLGFFGTATYAKFLNSVPGITIDNIVANASALDLNKANVITVLNIPQILENFDKYQNESLRNDTTYDYDESYRHIMKVRDVMEEPLHNDNQEFMIPFSLYADFNSTNFDFDLLDSGINDTETETETELPLMSNFTVDQDIINKTIEEGSIVGVKHNHILDDLVLQIPQAEENRLLWLPLSLLLMSAFFAHMGIKLIPWMLIGEVFPATLRSGASGISSGIGYLFGFLANKLFLKMLATMTLPGTFWFYSSVAFIGAFVLYFVLPETEGRSLVEIEQHFSGGLSLDKKTVAPTSANEVSRQRNKSINLSTSVSTHPKADIIIGIQTASSLPSKIESNDRHGHKVHIDLNSWESDRIFQRHLGEKNVHHLDNLHQHHHSVYAQNPRAYVRQNSRKNLPVDNDAAVFSTYL